MIIYLGKVLAQCIEFFWSIAKQVTSYLVNVSLVIYKKLLQFVGPDEPPSIPRRETAVWGLLGFLAISLAVKFPCHSVKTILIIGSSVIIFGLSLCIWRDLVQGDGEYRRNLGNSILTVLFTMILLTVIYCRVWFPRLHVEILQISEHIEEHPIFPAVAVLQNVDTSSQATLIDTPLKCWAGTYTETGPQCATLDSQQYLTSSSCNCNESWSPAIIEDFVPRGLHGGTWRYLQFTPSADLVSKNPGFLLTIQAWYNFNGTEAREALWVMPNPDLWLAVFDSSHSLADALASGYAPLNLINANGVTSINLHLNTLQSKRPRPMYFYRPIISTSPNVEIVCDVSGNYSYPCYTSLLLQFVSHDRSDYNERQAMSWTDAAASAGAYFAFVQFLSWIVSGQIWAA